MSALARVPEPELWVETLRDFEAFLALESDWNRVVDESGIEHPFLRHEWIRSWWEAFGAGRELHVLLVRDGARLIGLAPLMRGRRRVLGVSVRCIESIGNEQTPRFELPASSWPEQARSQIWEHLLAERDAWDLLLFAQLPSAAPVIEEIARFAAQAGLPVGTWASSHSPYLPLCGTWQDYLGTLRRKHLSNLRNRHKRLQSIGPLSHEVVSSRVETVAALGAALEMEAAAWKGAAGTAILSSPETRGFYRALAERAAGAGWLRLHFLRLGGQRIAFQYAFEYRKRAFVQKLGYDPAFAAYSPQNLLCSMLLEDAFARGLLEYDFLGDDEAWKREWAPATRPHAWLFVFRDDWMGRLLRAAKFHWLPALRGGLRRLGRPTAATTGAGA